MPLKRLLLLLVALDRGEARRRNVVHPLRRRRLARRADRCVLVRRPTRDSFRPRGGDGIDVLIDRIEAGVSVGSTFCLVSAADTSRTARPDQVASDNPDHDRADGFQAEGDELRAGGIKHGLNVNRIPLCLDWWVRGKNAGEVHHQAMAKALNAQRFIAVAFPGKRAPAPSAGTTSQCCDRPWATGKQTDGPAAILERRSGKVAHRTHQRLEHPLWHQEKTRKRR